MSELPPPPPGCTFKVQYLGEQLRVVIPGRRTVAFWASLLLATLVTIFATVMALVSPLPQVAVGKFFFVVMPFWGVLCFGWFFYVFKARTETVTLDRKFLETRGAVIPFAPKKMESAQVRSFELKAVGPAHYRQAALIFYGLDHRKLLFATGPHDQALAVQGADKDLEWLRGLLEAHHRKLHSRAK
jgi:hypothetical protein